MQHTTRPYHASFDIRFILFYYYQNLKSGKEISLLLLVAKSVRNNTLNKYIWAGIGNEGENVV